MSIIDQHDLQDSAPPAIIYHEAFSSTLRNYFKLYGVVVDSLNLLNIHILREDHDSELSVQSVQSVQSVHTIGMRGLNN